MAKNNNSFYYYTNNALSNGQVLDTFTNTHDLYRGRCFGKGKLNKRLADDRPGPPKAINSIRGKASAS